MKRFVVLFAFTMVMGSAPARAETADSDPKAVAVADQVMEALGGKARWDALRGIRWSFIIEVNDTVRADRRHAWDKFSGMHRVEGVNRSGQPYCVVHDLNTGRGKAWVAGAPAGGDTLQRLLDYGKAVWVNDTYWFLMPYKMRDPGVTLGYDGEVKDGDVVYDKIALSFHDVGMTPGDHYWVYVNRANHRVEKWDMILQDEKPPAVGDTWTGWEEHDGLWFATAHWRDHRNIATRNVEAVDAFDAGTFTAP